MKICNVDTIDKNRKKKLKDFVFFLRRSKCGLRYINNFVDRKCVLIEASNGLLTAYTTEPALNLWYNQ